MCVMMYSRKFYKSAAWKKKRQEILKRDNYECQHCKKKGLVVRGTEVHHIIHLKDDFSRRLDNDNLITLCKACHNLEHPEKLKKNKKYKEYVPKELWI